MSGQETQNKFTASGLFVKSAKVWRPMKIGFEGWAKAWKVNDDGEGGFRNVDQRGEEGQRRFARH